jgi:hypothetical protein
MPEDTTTKLSKTIRAVELDATLKRLKKHGVKAWRPSGIARNRLIELLIVACHKLDPEDPRRAFKAVRRKADTLY